MRGYIESQITETVRIMDLMLSDVCIAETLAAASQACISCLEGDGKILLAGNGGSAADAQHIAGELVSRFAFDRPSLSAIALTTDTSILTAIGNDYGYHKLFARQIQAHGQKGDIFVAYSTSGKSPNILMALDEAETVSLLFQDVEEVDLSLVQIICAAHRSAVRNDKELTMQGSLPDAFVQIIDDAGLNGHIGCLADARDCSVWQDS